MALPVNLINIDAEMSVIGGILLDNDALSRAAAGQISAEDFHDRRHALVWQAILALDERNEPADLVTVGTELQRTNHLDDSGGPGYLSTLVDYVPTAANIGYYLALVKGCAARRRLAAVGREIVATAGEAETHGEALDTAEAKLLGLRSTTTVQSGPQPVQGLLAPAFRCIEDRYRNGGGVAGLSTGFHDLDRMTAGLQPGDLIIIAGRPSMGKTALGLNVGENAGAAGERVLIFSIEMNRGQLVNRLIASQGKIDSQRIRTGNFGSKDWQKMQVAGERLHGMPLLIDDSPAPSVLDIRGAARRTKREGGLSLIVIDYLQLIRPVKSHPTREREVADISRSLKALARELEVPILVLAQLNRSGESNATPRRPIMSDLRESGSLEQDADLIIFPWREAAYCTECRAKGADCGKGHYRLAELIVGKQRNGPVGTVHCAWLPEITSFVAL